MTPLSLPQLIKGPPHTCEKFCIQTWTSKLLKRYGFVRLENDWKKFNFQGKNQFLKLYFYSWK